MGGTSANNHPFPLLPSVFPVLAVIRTRTQQKPLVLHSAINDNLCFNFGQLVISLCLSHSPSGGGCNWCSRWEGVTTRRGSSSWKIGYLLILFNPINPQFQRRRSLLLFECEGVGELMLLIHRRRCRGVGDTNRHSKVSSFSSLLI